MDAIIKAVGLVGLGSAAYAGGREISFWLSWNRRRKELYETAKEEARLSGKPLLVVGRPRYRDHG